MEELRDKLLDWAKQFETPDFIKDDPIFFPHKYNDKKDIEISAFLTSWIAFGNRKLIMQQAEILDNLMGNSPYAFIMNKVWEHPDTYKHVNDVCLQMGVRLITLKSKYDFVSLAVHKKRFPSTNARFCTSELKMKPMIDYVLSLKESCIIIQGIRAGESTARAAMEEECMYFKSYFQPNKKGRTENYRSKDVKEWCSQFDASVLRPIFKWSAQQVIDCILDAGQKPNPLYYRGFSRVGCFPCIMCRHKEIELIAKNRTEMKKILIICVLFALIAGCASPRNSVENHPAKNSPQPDALPDNKENRFTKQFQEADSMFNEKYRLNE